MTYRFSPLVHLFALIGCALLALGLGIVGLSTPVAAQDGNLLQDPGFEGGYTGRGRGDLNIAAPWSLFNQDGPRSADWQMRADKVFAFPHRTPPEVRSGALSQNINGGFVTFAVAIHQTVPVPANTVLNASIWARIKTCNIAPNADNCGSAVESGAFVRVGIDPTGGTNPYAASVIWSNNIAPHDRWEQAAVSARTTGGVATFFAFFTQSSPSQLNNVWFDDAYFGTGGPGGAPAAGATGAAPVIPPTPIPPTAFVAIRQAPRADGSQWHFVQPGDTLTGIATAYGTTAESIRDLNNLRSTRFIFVNQELLIFPAGSRPAGSATPRPTLPMPTLDPTEQAWLNRNQGIIGPTPIGFGG